MATPKRGYLVTNFGSSRMFNFNGFKLEICHGITIKLEPDQLELATYLSKQKMISVVREISNLPL